MKVKFQDPQFAFQLLRVLGSASSRQAEVGECFAVAEHIAEGDFESWTREWTRAASRLQAAADASLAAGHRVSAADTYLRAANYFRAAEFYLHGTPDDPRIVELSERSARCFREGLRASDVRFEETALAYEGTSLPGIFYSAGPGRRRTLVAYLDARGVLPRDGGLARLSRQHLVCWAYQQPCVVDDRDAASLFGPNQSGV